MGIAQGTFFWGARFSGRDRRPAVGGYRDFGVPWDLF
jgi:hypothetical protein